MGNPILLIIVAATMFAVIGGLTLASHLYNLNGIKSKTVGDGQHGTARFASKGELRQDIQIRAVRAEGMESRQRKRPPSAARRDRRMSE